MMTDGPTEAAIRVLIVDDHQLFSEGIASLLSLHPEIQVVGTASNGEEALTQTALLQPHVILMDVEMPILDGLQTLCALRQQFPACRVLMLTSFPHDAYIQAAMRAGAWGYMLKATRSVDLAQAIRAIHHNVMQFTPAIIEKLMAPDGIASTEPPQTLSNSWRRGDPAFRLTNRELEVLQLVCQGRNNHEIADALVISEGTVKNHLSSILNQLGVRDRTQAAIYAREIGLV